MKELIRIEIFHPRHTGLVSDAFERLFPVPSDTVKKFKEALDEVIENIVFHAYEEPERFWMEVLFQGDDTSCRMDISDAGIPFDFEDYRSESIEKTADHTKGFYHIYDLVERFYFSNIPGKGKRFTLIAPFPVPAVPNVTAAPGKQPDSGALAAQVDVRRFEPSDAEGIARLIYRNYDHTYYKTFYYDPLAIMDANTSGQIVSIVALCGGLVIGHFALILSSMSNIAEIGAAVVDPGFKGHGIMTRMFEYLIATAREMKLNALYGEAIMIHPYSQKANRRQGMAESAILLGEVPSSLEIEHRFKETMRSGAVEAFLLFDRHERRLHLPLLYREKITAAYAEADVPFHDSENGASPQERTIEHRYNPMLNIGVIVIDAAVIPSRFDAALDSLLLTHCDMIYADINLHRIAEIDDLVSFLNTRRFFYAGVMFSFYHNEDYLRLQRKNALGIDEEQLVCYSESARDLLAFILEDERRIQ